MPPLQTPKHRSYSIYRRRSAERVSRVLWKNASKQIEILEGQLQQRATSTLHPRLRAANDQRIFDQTKKALTDLKETVLKGDGTEQTENGGYSSVLEPRASLLVTDRQERQ